MIRVGFAPALDAGWIGGLNYYRNLFIALSELRASGLRFVLFAGPSANLEWVPESEVIAVERSAFVERGAAANILRRAVRRLAGRDLLLARLARTVDVLSHSGPLPGIRRPRTAGWIPDLQHRFLPELFSTAERRVRDRVVTEHLEHCSVVLVSSEMARANLAAFPARTRARIEVLRFVASPPDLRALPDANILRKKYRLPERYFYLPNQFWVHKNHRIVIEALSYAEARQAHVVCTGEMRDYRRPGFYEELMEAARDVRDRFRVLGVVPQPDAAALMRDAVAVINPSRFEGWSTTVEEAKSLGKRVLLSDIAVHREQAPERAFYFHPDDAEALARALHEALATFDLREESRALQRATVALPERRRRFAAKFVEAVRLASDSL